MSGVSGINSSLPVIFPGRGHGANKTSTVQGGDNPAPGNPAQAARATLASRPDLAGKPFGAIASLFARGLPLPPVENAPIAPITSDTSTSGGAGDTSTDTSTNTGTSLTSDAGTDAASTDPTSGTSTDTITATA